MPSYVFPSDALPLDPKDGEQPILRVDRRISDGRGAVLMVPPAGLATPEEWGRILAFTFSVLVQAYRDTGVDPLVAGEAMFRGFSDAVGERNVRLRIRVRAEGS